MLKGYNRHTVIANRSGKRRFAQHASSASLLNSSIGSSTGVVSNSIFSNVERDFLDNIINHHDERVVRRLYRDIYYHDVVAGGAVDIQSTLPFSEFTLSGVEDKERLAKFEQSLENIHIYNLLQSLSVDYMVLGAFCSAPNFDSSDKTYKSLIPVNLDMCDVTPSPIYNMDPLIDLKFEPSYKEFLNGSDPRFQYYVEMMPEWMINGIKMGKVKLDPISVIYIPRKTFSTSSLGTSYFRRILPLHLLEKSLIRGTILQAQRRQRAIGHIKIGDEDWIPNNDEIGAHVQQFLNADLDPIGAIIGTRQAVEYQEVRQATDFWKINEDFEFIKSAKFNGLGLNDTILSGEANWNCVTGDTLIPSENGIIRIDSFGKNEDKIKDINLKVGSRYKPVKAAKWLYRGKKPTIKVITEHGNEICSTPNGPLLVLRDNKIDWVLTEDIKIGDYLCINPVQKVRKTRLKLNLSDPIQIVHGGRLKSVNKPKYMDESLGFIIGLLVSEGTIDTSNRLHISNSNEEILVSFGNMVEKVFNKEVVYYKYKDNGEKYVVNGVSGTVNKDCFSAIVNSQPIVGWMKELGVIQKNGLAKRASYFKEIPWSILQADEKSQLAFLAAYLEGDGNLRKDTGRISFFSSSKVLIKQMQIILNAHGYAPKIAKMKTAYALRLIYKESASLYKKLKPYLVSDKLRDIENIYDRNTKASNSHGFNIDFLNSFVKSRVIHKNRYGTEFINDDGKSVILNKWKVPSIADKKLLYDIHERGGYNYFMECINKISKSLYYDLKELFKLNYTFTKVVSIKNNGIKHVYDLSMEKGKEPAFIANGVVIHNTLDSALSQFIDKIRTHRDDVTNQLFYERTFPNIAVANDYKRGNDRRFELLGTEDFLKDIDGYENMDENKKKELTASISRRVSMYKRAYGLRASRITDVENINEYEMPIVNWQKQLKPRGDRDYMELLERMTEKGIPIPLRMLASAGGVNAEDIEDGLDDDLELRKKFKQQNDAIAEITGEAGGEEEGGFGSFASVVKSNFDSFSDGKTTASGIRRMNFANRFNEENSHPFRLRTKDKSGRLKDISPKRRRELDDAINKQIAILSAEHDEVEVKKQNEKHKNSIRKRTYSYAKHN